MTCLAAGKNNTVTGLAARRNDNPMTIYVTTRQGRDDNVIRAGRGRIDYVRRVVCRVLWNDWAGAGLRWWPEHVRRSCCWPTWPRVVGNDNITRTGSIEVVSYTRMPRRRGRWHDDARWRRRRSSIGYCREILKKSATCEVGLTYWQCSQTFIKMFVHAIEPVAYAANFGLTILDVTFQPRVEPSQIPHNLSLLLGSVLLSKAILLWRMSVTE